MITTMHRMITSLALCIFLAGVATCRGDMIISGLNTDKHERFANHADFIGLAATAGFDLDFSGVARASNGFWATMISPTHFVTANHAKASGNVVFHHDNDPNGTTTTRTIIVGGTRIGTTDIWVGELNTAIDAPVAVYPISSGVSFDEIFYQVGRGPLQGANNTTGFRVGRNRASGLLPGAELTDSDGVVIATTDSLVYFDDSLAGDIEAPLEENTDDLIDDETFLVGGDSGGPSFQLSITGEMLLLGTHSFVTNKGTDNNSPFFFRRASGDAYLPNYSSAILLATVPEPSPLVTIPAVAVLIGLVGLVRRFKAAPIG